MQGLSRRFMGFAVLVALLGLFVVGAPVAANLTDANHDYISIISRTYAVEPKPTMRVG